MTTISRIAIDISQVGGRRRQGTTIAATVRATSATVQMTVSRNTDGLGDCVLIRTTTTNAASRGYCT
jgi:hypothetical protein